MQPKFGGCGKFIANQDGAKCNKCTGVYHRACVNIPDKARVTPSWMCPTCKCALPRNNKPSTPVRGAALQFLGVDNEPVDAEQMHFMSPDVEPQMLPQVSEGDMMPRLLSLITELNGHIVTFNEREVVLKNEIALLREELHENRFKNGNFDALEVEVKLLREEIKRMNENNIRSNVTIENADLHVKPLVQHNEQKSKKPKNYHKNESGGNIQSGSTGSLPGTSQDRRVEHSDILLNPASNSLIPDMILPAITKPIQSSVIDIDIDRQVEKWTTVVNKRRSRVTVRGVGDVDEELKAVENLKMIHLWSLAPGTTEDKVVNYMTKRNVTGKGHYAAEKIQLKHNSTV